MPFDEEIFYKFDLNALVTFMVVYREKGVSRAARMLNVTQPAVSNSLGKLRRRFDDRLFIPRGKYVEPTPKAVQIAESLAPAMSQFQAIIGSAIFHEGQSEGANF
ncbi:LysR family transcriptional regulator [Pseudomonas sp. B21-040]|uniref:helix-turn-helix domain-containing protein n=1 Tax=Pseudomonas sp. B21-040 TaxID=2895486 RepID=UPI000FB5440C|nr:LysR family transcriptional regulator [Pseudomonas sp. B21-040]UVL43191.1 LysR family transcriptional regulator [Pseudomonas sp. B21-040]